MTAYLKRCIVEVGAKENSLAHALVIAVARVTNDPITYWIEWGDLLQAADVDLSK
jgi:hypothetical protein